VRCRLEVFEGRWHVFQLQAAQLHSARSAIAAIAEFARERITAGADEEERAQAGAHLDAWNEARALVSP
jgi:hypothetical protein